MKRLIGLALAVSTVLAVPALAAPERVRIRGTVTALVGDTLTVRTTDGTDATVMLDDKTGYRQIVKSSLDKVDKDAFIGTATKDVGGQLIALEVVVFPAAMKGTGEGHYGWDKIPDTTVAGGGATPSAMTNGTVSTVAQSGNNTGGPPAAANTSMTNGTVATTAAAGGAKKITVTYKGGEQTILVPPTAPIVTFSSGSRADVTNGATVFINAVTDDGKTTAASVAVGTDGVKPPM